MFNERIENRTKRFMFNTHIENITKVLIFMERKCKKNLPRKIILPKKTLSLQNIIYSLFKLNFYVEG